MTTYLPPHPEPAHPAKLDIKTVKLAVGTRLWRIHLASYGAVFFGNTGTNRFDSPDRAFGVMYVGWDEACAFVETFGHKTGQKFVTESQLKGRHLSSLVTKRELALVDLAGEGGLATAGADSRLFSNSHPQAQRWSKAFYLHSCTPDGILYPARHDASKTSCALFDRVTPAAFDVTEHGSLFDPHNAVLLATLLKTYGFALIGS